MRSLMTLPRTSSPSILCCHTESYILEKRGKDASQKIDHCSSTSLACNKPRTLQPGKLILDDKENTEGATRATPSRRGGY